jgi:hypothetical protein
MPRGSSGRKGLAAATRPEAFPIKANDFPLKWIVSGNALIVVPSPGQFSGTYPEISAESKLDEQFGLVKIYGPPLK